MHTNETILLQRLTAKSKNHEGQLKLQQKYSFTDPSTSPIMRVLQYVICAKASENVFYKVATLVTL